jgi:hypothetical protein
MDLDHAVIVVVVPRKLDVAVQPRGADGADDEVSADGRAHRRFSCGKPGLQSQRVDLERAGDRTAQRPALGRELRLLAAPAAKPGFDHAATVLRMWPDRFEKSPSSCKRRLQKVLIDETTLPRNSVNSAIQPGNTISTLTSRPASPPGCDGDVDPLPQDNDTRHCPPLPARVWPVKGGRAGSL